MKSKQNDYHTYKYLFLDRDGVINVERPKDYAKTVSEFVFIDGSIQAIVQLSEYFDKIFIITNQRGIGRGVFTEYDLSQVHNHMTQMIERAGGRIDQIYYCTAISESDINRKPNIGMAFQAQRDFPEVDFSKSIFVGNSKSDIIFANRLNMLAVLVGDKYQSGHDVYKISDLYFQNLVKFAEAVANSNK